MSFAVRLDVKGLSGLDVLDDEFNARVRLPHLVKNGAGYDAKASLRVGGSAQPRHKCPGDQREPHDHPKFLHSIHDISCLLATQIRWAYPRGFSYYLSTRAR